MGLRAKRMWFPRPSYAIMYDVLSITHSRSSFLLFYVRDARDDV